MDKACGVIRKHSILREFLVSITVCTSELVFEMWEEIPKILLTMFRAAVLSQTVTLCGLPW